MTVTKLLSEGYQQLLDEALTRGLVFQNLRLGTGPFGASLYPIDPKRPVHLYVPETLLLDLSLVDFNANQIGEEVTLPDESLRAFFNRYLSLIIPETAIEQRLRLEEEIKAEDLSAWAYGKNLNSLSTFLSISAGVEAIRLRLARARTFTYEGKAVLMPILDLANHANAGLSFRTQKGIYIDGTSATDELFVTYGSKDSLHLLNTYSFLSPCSLAFAMPCSFNLKSHAVRASRLVVLDSLNEMSPGKPGFPALSTLADGTARLSWAMLGFKDQPKLPLQIWQRVCQLLGVTDGLSMFNIMRRYAAQRATELEERGQQVRDEELRRLLCQAAQDYLAALDHVAAD